MPEEKDQTQTLSQLFKSVSAAFDEISESQLSSSDARFQSQVKNAISQCTAALNQVQALTLFSENETFDDLTTESIRFLTIPAYLGYFHSRLTDDRPEALASAKDFYQEFIEACKLYSIPSTPFSADAEIQKNQNNIDPRMPEQLRQQMLAREAKLRWFNERKSIKDRLKNQCEYIQQAHVDEEIKRSYYTDLVRWWAIQANEEIPNLRMELDFIIRRPEHQKHLEELRKQQDKSTSRKAFVITKEMARNRVFGPGYPSQPSMSLEEFRKVQIENQSFPEASGHGEEIVETFKGDVRRVDPADRLAKADAQDEEEDDEKEDRDDPVHRAKLQDMDAYKDEFRAGSGNTYRRL